MYKSLLTQIAPNSENSTTYKKKVFFFFENMKNLATNKMKVLKNKNML